MEKPSSKSKNRLDSIVIGSGPNGLAAAIALAQAGHSVKVYEKASTAGGGARSEALTLPGFVHDVCSAAHPLGIASPFFSTLPLEKHGLTWIHSPIPIAHPWDDGKGDNASAVVLERSVEKTAERLGEDRKNYLSLMKPLVSDWEILRNEILGPMLHLPRHPFRLAKFGLKAIQSAEKLARSHFVTGQARALFGGIAAHSSMRLSSPASAAVGLVLQIAGHAEGWPIARGGSQSISNALISYLRSLGGEVITDTYVKSLKDLPPARWTFLDLTPKQIIEIAEDHLPESFIHKLRKYHYGPGVFKLDWALSGPIPWKSKDCLNAGTIHLGSTLEEMSASEDAVASGTTSQKPYILLCQSSLFDPTRAPPGQHTAWAYCHVPNGYKEDMTSAIEAQIERFAPGFKSLVLARHKLFPSDLEKKNPNLVGGDISGGMNSFSQLLFRPVIQMKAYATPNKGIYICSASTPPGPGVHGMCGFNAAKKALS